ncbi:hypothetical protein FBU30_003406 [Linnemannia zychae]|nr:hypothetical protein FBU30_003406 [Linnemannia zychae]
MRFYIVLLALSMCAWVVLAGVSGDGNVHISQVGTHAAKVEAVDDTTAPTNDAAATDVATPDAAADTAAANEPTDPAIVNGGTPLPAPVGPKTPAEDKADSVLSCMDGCSGNAKCQQDCVSTGYNVPMSAPIPSVSASIPPPIGVTVTSVAATATAPASAATTTAATAPKPQGANAASNIGVSYRMIGAAAVVAVASVFAGL